MIITIIIAFRNYYDKYSFIRIIEILVKERKVIKF